jgi:hypothetical protein
MFCPRPPAITGDQVPNRLSRVWRLVIRAAPLPPTDCLCTSFLTLHWFDGVLALLSVQLLAFAFFVDTRTRDE